MRTETEKDLLASELRGEKYDEACKRILQNKEIIAPILQMLIPEYKEYSVEDVIRFIDADSISMDTPVEDIPVGIRGEQTEFSSVSEKLIRFDSMFRAINPKLSDHNLVVSLHIDIEVQNDYKPGNPPYPIVKRGIYYAAREISRQLGTLTETTDYGKLEKIYSIWICNENIPPNLRGTITGYDIKKKDIMGISDESDFDYDLISVIIVRRGNDEAEPGIFDYLNGVFRSELEKISCYVDTENNEKLVKEVEQMTGLGATLIDKGMQKGLMKGKEEGIQIGVDNSIQKLASHYMEQDKSLDYEKALEMAKSILK